MCAWMYAYLADGSGQTACLYRYLKASNCRIKLLNQVASTRMSESSGKRYAYGAEWVKEVGREDKRQRSWAVDRRKGPRPSRRGTEEERDQQTTLLIKVPQVNKR